MAWHLNVREGVENDRNAYGVSRVSDLQRGVHVSLLTGMLLENRAGVVLTTLSLFFNVLL